MEDQDTSEYKRSTFTDERYMRKGVHIHVCTTHPRYPNLSRGIFMEGSNFWDISAFERSGSTRDDSENARDAGGSENW